jgi:hypothetical protein
MSNCSAKKDPVDGKITFTYDECPPPEEGPPAKITLEFEYIDKYWFEVRPPDQGRKTITNGTKQEKLKKSIIQVPDLNNPENANGDVVNFIDTIYYQQEYEIVNSSDELITSRPVYRRYCKADASYDEQYFYHIFEWPLSHTLPPRLAGGITVVTPPPPPPNSEGGEVSCPTYAVESVNVSGTLNLARVDSQVTGVPEGAIVYHGGTTDNKIFFFYENTTNKQMIAVGDVINGWTVDKVVNYNSEYLNEKSVRTTETVRRRVSKVSDKNKTPGFIFVNNNNGAEDRIINIGDKVSGYGIQPDTVVENIQGLKIFLSRPLKYKNRRKVRNVAFTKTDLVNNISNQILCYAEISGGSANFAKDAYYAKNIPSTPQYTSTIYHVFDDDKNKNIQLTTSKDIKVVAKSQNDSGGSDDSTNRKHYEVTFLDGTTITSKNDIQISITDDQTASGVNRKSFVSEIDIVNTKTFRVWFKRLDNRDNGYVRGWSVTRVQGQAVLGSNRIKVVAGKGIIDRSAVCGVYISNDKKFYTYTPLFYSRDTFCEPSALEDATGKYILGNVILNDGSFRIKEKFLCVSPGNNEAYEINSIFWTHFQRPADKDEIEKWVPKLKSSNFLLIQNEIVDSEKTILNNKTVLSVKDVECDNTITPDYTKVYYPYQEINTFNEYLNPVQTQPSYDECIDVKSADAYTAEEISNRITTNLQESFNMSNIVLPEEMYKRIISNENSLQNILINAVKTIESSVPKSTTIPNLPPLIEGEDQSGKIYKTFTGYRIPPRFKSLEYIIDDFSFVSDSNIIPDTEENRITIVLKSIPRWTGNASSEGQTGPTINPMDGLLIVTNKDSNGFVTSITTQAEPFGAVPVLPGTPVGSTKSWAAGPAPQYIWHGEANTANDPYGTNYQSGYPKVLNFRVNEVSRTIANAVKNKGNPFMDEPPYAKLTQELKSTDNTIKVDDTSQFISSGYLIIPKFIIKKEINLETKNETLRHYYLGEEIIYYKDKTETEFLGCTRQMFDTTYTFEDSSNSGFIESDITYIIKTLGNVDWKQYGAPEGYRVGTVFKATVDGSGTNESGEVYLFGSILVPFEGSTFVSHSYQKNNYLSQYWPVEIQNKNVL